MPQHDISQALVSYTLYLADNTLILAQRNAEWCGHGPILEQDIALANISLDLLGQARNFYQYAAHLINKLEPSERKNFISKETHSEEITEDTLAYLRSAKEFQNCLLVELPRGDWGFTILRQFLFSTYQYLLYTRLQESKDQQLAAIAVKSLKEVNYHLRWSSEWVIRLGDGTEESHQRMLISLNELWQYAGELFEPAPYESVVIRAGEAIDITELYQEWKDRVKEILDEATLPIPTNIKMQKGGKEGMHTPHLEKILTELQSLQRTYPGAEW